MGTKEDIKSLLVKECWTITKMAEAMSERTGRKYSIKTLSQKLTNNTIRYEEYKLIVDILGYSIELVKK
ncbi:LLM class flavin-dependent oxidoreductase [bacterium]|nr:LLM class flavin-dependent oxidoreductase [bacterium]